MKDNNTTLEARATALGSEWARMPKAGERLEGLSRAHLYQLLTDGKLRSHVIKKKHCVKGIRLIHLPSLRALITAEVEASSMEASGV